MRHLHRVLELQRRQQLAEDLAAEYFVDQGVVVFHDVADRAALAQVRLGYGCAGHHGKSAGWRQAGKVPALPLVTGLGINLL
jgi:hypothetical protein